MERRRADQDPTGSLPPRAPLTGRLPAPVEQHRRTQHARQAYEKASATAVGRAEARCSRCDEEIDNGISASWLVDVPADSSRLRTSQFSPRRA